jgi:hypothetical protein
MGGHRPEYFSPAELDIRDPDFPRKCVAWQQQQQCEIADLIARTKETLTAARLLIQEADRILALR